MLPDGNYLQSSVFSDLGRGSGRRVLLWFLYKAGTVLQTDIGVFGGKYDGGTVKADFNSVLRNAFAKNFKRSIGTTYAFSAMRSQRHSPVES